MPHSKLSGFGSGILLPISKIKNTFPPALPLHDKILDN
jgi:hypothetical protein